MSRDKGGRRGPLGKLAGIVGSGIGMAAEYNEHRKEMKMQLSRGNSRQDLDDAIAGPSTQPQPGMRDFGKSDLPPAYGEVAGDRSIASGVPSTYDKKADMTYDEQDDEDNDDNLDGESLEDDEEDWQLDEIVGERQMIADGPPSYEQNVEGYGNNDNLVRDDLMTSQSVYPAGQPTVRQPLPCPVIIPQRRPRAKARGFVRAYAPVLAETGIDQATFLSFLDNFQKSSQASPVFTVVAMSAGVVGTAIPGPISMAVTMAVQIGSKIGSEAHSRYLTNDFLNRMNLQLFQLHGLFCMIVKYKPEVDLNESSSRTDIGKRFGLRPESVNLSTSQVVAKYGRAVVDDTNMGNKTMSERMQNLRLASDNTRGAVELPQAAPLIFPDVDKAIVTNGAENTFKNQAKDAQMFLADYLDRRAHVQYASQDAHSALNIPEEQRRFKSKLANDLADPNHPVYQVGLRSLVSGDGTQTGRGDRRFEKRMRKGEKKYRKEERKAFKYEQKMDEGRDLSTKKQVRYDRYMAIREERMDTVGGRGGGGTHSGYYDDYDQYGHFGPRGGLSGRRGLGRGGFGRGGSGRSWDDDYDQYGGRCRRRGGPINGIIGAVAHAASNRSAPFNDQQNTGTAPAAPHGSQQSREYEDSYDHRYGYDEAYADDIDAHRRSMGDRTAAHSGPAPYGEQAGYGEAGYRDPGYHALAQYGDRRSGRVGRSGPASGVRRMMREDVLYLMIVNMPSEAELTAATEELNRQRVW